MSFDGDEQEQQLNEYCDTFLRVLEAAFGSEKRVCATVFQDDSVSPLPLRMVAVHLDRPLRNRITVDAIESDALRQNLKQLNAKFLNFQNTRSGVYSQR